MRNQGSTYNYRCDIYNYIYNIKHINKSFNPKVHGNFILKENIIYFLQTHSHKITYNSHTFIL